MFIWFVLFYLWECRGVVVNVVLLVGWILLFDEVIYFVIKFGLWVFFIVLVEE